MRTPQEVIQAILDHNGWGVVTGGFWYRTDNETKNQQVVLRYGVYDTPPMGVFVYDYSELDDLVEHMLEIADLDDWVDFETFYKDY